MIINLANVRQVLLCAVFRICLAIMTYLLWNDVTCIYSADYVDLLYLLFILCCLSDCESSPSLYQLPVMNALLFTYITFTNDLSTSVTTMMNAMFLFSWFFHLNFLLKKFATDWKFGFFRLLYVIGLLQLGNLPCC